MFKDTLLISVKFVLQNVKGHGATTKQRIDYVTIFYKKNIWKLLIWALVAISESDLIYVANVQRW